MKEQYGVAGVKHRSSTAEYLSKEGEVLLPLVEEARLEARELVEVAERAALEAVLTLSAQGVAGPWHRGKGASGIRWHGPMAGKACMSDRTVSQRQGIIKLIVNWMD